MHFGHHPEVALPCNERRAYCLSRAEARYLHDKHIPAYFRHGIDVAPGDVVFDVGANIGLFALAVLQRCRGEATIYAFEPVPVVRRALRLNAGRFGGGRLKVFPYGLSRRRGRLAYAYMPRLPGRSATAFDRYGLPPSQERFRACVRREIEAGRRFPLLGRLPAPLRRLVATIATHWLTRVKVIPSEVRTVSEALHDLHIDRVDLLKVDAAGAELEVLEGIAPADWQRFGQIVVRIDRFSERAADIVALLEMRGFGRIRLDQADDRPGDDTGMVYAVAGVRDWPPRDGRALPGHSVPAGSPANCMESS